MAGAFSSEAPPKGEVTIIVGPAIADVPDEVEIDSLLRRRMKTASLAEAVADRFDAIDPATVRTNAVIFAPTDAARLISHLEEAGVRAGTSSPGRVRLMTHLDVDDAGIDRACAAIAGCP